MLAGTGRALRGGLHPQPDDAVPSSADGAPAGTVVKVGDVGQTFRAALQSAPAGTPGLNPCPLFPHLMDWNFIGRASFGFLTGAAIAAVIVGLFASGLFLLTWIDKFNPFVFVLVLFIMKIAFVVCSVVFMMNTPIVLLFAYFYRGPLAGAMAIGATAGGVEAYWLAAFSDRPNYGGDAFLAFLGIVSGAIIAWRVWTEIRLPTAPGWSPPTPHQRRPPTSS